MYMVTLFMGFAFVLCLYSSSIHPTSFGMAAVILLLFLCFLFLYEPFNVTIDFYFIETLRICIVLISVIIAIESFLSIVSFVASLDLFSLVRKYNHSLIILSQSFLVLVLCALSVANAVWLFLQVRGLWTRHFLVLIQVLHAVSSFLLLTQSLLQGMLSLPFPFGLPLRFSPLSPFPLLPHPLLLPFPSLSHSLSLPPPFPPICTHACVDNLLTIVLWYSAGLYLYVSCGTREMPTREKAKHLRSQLNLNYMFLVYNITTNVAITYYGQSIFKLPSLSYMTGDAAYRLYSIFRLRYLVAYRAFSIVQLRRLIAYGGQRLRYLRQAAEAPTEVAYEEDPFPSAVPEETCDHTRASQPAMDILRVGRVWHPNQMYA